MFPHSSCNSTPKQMLPSKTVLCQILTALICSNSLTGLSKLSPFVKMLPCPHSSATVEAPPAPPPRGHLSYERRVRTLCSVEAIESRLEAITTSSKKLLGSAFPAKPTRKGRWPTVTNSGLPGARVARGRVWKGQGWWDLVGAGEVPKDL